MFCVWQYFQKEMEQNEFQDTADVGMQHQNKPLAPSRKDVSEIPKLTHDRRERMAPAHDGNLGNLTLKDYVSRKCLQAEEYTSSLPQEQCMSGRDFCVVRIVHTEPMIFLCG